MTRNISSNAACLNRPRSIGVVPVNNSYRITPSASTSAPVSTSTGLIAACSDAMYSGFPATVPMAVNTVCSVNCIPEVAFANPKSMTFGTALSS